MIGHIWCQFGITYGQSVILALRSPGSLKLFSFSMWSGSHEGDQSQAHASPGWGDV